MAKCTKQSNFLQESSTQAQIIDIDALIKFSDRKIFSHIFSKNQENRQKMAKLVPKIRKVVQNREFVHPNPLYLYSNDRYSSLD